MLSNPLAGLSEHPAALLRRRFTCRDTLQAAHIGYLPNGGLYIPCETAYPLKARVCLLLSVAGEQTELCLTGTVVLTGPLPGVWAGRCGVGLAFTDDGAAAALDKAMRYNRVAGA